MKRYIVELEENVYVADWEGDPGRTTRRAYAKVFDNRQEAVNAVTDARSYRLFEEAVLILICPDRREVI